MKKYLTVILFIFFGISYGNSQLFISEYTKQKIYLGPENININLGELSRVYKEPLQKARVELEFLKKEITENISLLNAKEKRKSKEKKELESLIEQELKIVEEIKKIKILNNKWNEEREKMNLLKEAYDQIQLGMCLEFKTKDSIYCSTEIMIKEIDLSKGVEYRETFFAKKCLPGTKLVHGCPGKCKSSGNMGLCLAYINVKVDKGFLLEDLSGKEFNVKNGPSEMIFNEIKEFFFTERKVTSKNIIYQSFFKDTGAKCHIENWTKVSCK